MVWGYGDDATLRRFWPYVKARIIRIYPAYWAVFAATAWYVGAQPLADPAALIRSLSLYGRGPWLVRTAWSLPFEVMLYLGFSLLFIIGRGPFSIIACAWCALVFSQVHGWARISTSMWLSPYILEWYLGALGAVVVRAVRPRGSAIGLWLSVALVLLAGIREDICRARGEPSCVDISIPYLLLIIAGVSYELQRARQYPRLLMIAGEASYSIYLIHWYMVNWLVTSPMWNHPVVSIRGGLDAQRTGVVLLVLCAGVAWWALVERPLLQFVRWAWTTKDYGRTTRRKSQ